MTPTPPDRPSQTDYLSLVDMHFVRTHRGFGMPIVMQGIWMFDDVVDDDTLTEIHQGIANGHLDRRVIRPYIPGARHYWARGASIAPIQYTTQAIPREQIVDWCNERAQTRLNPEHGIGWELSTARISDGGMVVSLVCSHALTDARGLISAVNAAVSGATGNIATNIKRKPLWSELTDALAQYWAFIVGSLIAFYRIFIQGSNRDEVVRFMRRNRVNALRKRRATTVAKSGKVAPNWSEATTIIDIIADEWDAVAAKSNGTSNSLFVCIVSNLLFSSGARGLNEHVTIGMPFDVSDGKTQELRSNALTMSTLTWKPRGSRYGELFLIRDKSREAFQKVAANVVPEEVRPAALPLATLHIVPDRIASKLTHAGSVADAIASNVGTLPDTLTKLGKYPVVSTAARAVHPRLTATQALAQDLVIDACLLRNGDHYTLSINGLDPVRFPNSRSLRNLAIKELEKWGLVPQSWESDQPGLGIPGGPSALF
ncbi:hypothetical protein IEU95_03125 [Hoyosella rhizosphaerae]|uniref:Uncharacterized protein n=1 Tax=Hoyosella rhizosphaerae TaxID=1755582 RepID=A0A916UD00_9ACTN|nr:hypothetical protein [Hoyosella rhizosphaerae]MBN4925807.1 hypothetical protein [Hoyosella rhizosphaerae]GGC67799.1 hypothetical protein GCM10011410_20640 [Hoyosella rhizosphaerae]